MRKVLIVTPHFPPVNAPDHQRVRMALPYLMDYGWDPTVLAVRPQLVEGATLDPLLERTIPVDVQVCRVGALPARATRLFGLGSLAMRSLLSLRREGNRLLGGGSTRKAARRNAATERPFDLVFFSTAQFPVMSLGPFWRRRFGIPYIVDMQDPWLDDYYERTRASPPGGKFKYQISRFTARQLEPRVMRDVSQVICVSPAYAETLHRRYPHLRQDQFIVLPFGAPTKDFELLPTLNLKQGLFDNSDGKQHWLYVGSAGTIMETAVRFLFFGLARLRQKNPEVWRNVQLHFAGTSYAPRGRGVKTIQPIAQEYGLADIVEERTDRAAYFETLKALTEADALMIIGSDSPSYSASKLYPYMLARKPMLAILHQDSPAVKILRECGAANVVTFKPGHLELSRAAMAHALQQTYEMAKQGIAPQIDETEFAKYSAREMTGKMCNVFDRATAQK